ncbi:MAG: hypothetical protein Q7U18_03735 [Methylobacter sp.]|nr:hypothetical protein [Methylobacter sp.]
MKKNILRARMRWFLFALFLWPQLVMAGNDEPLCEAEVPLTLTNQEMAEAGFEPGGFTPFFLGMIAGPRIGLEWNDGRNVRTLEVLRALPYAGNLVGLFLCVEALSGYRMTSIAGETGIDDWRREVYFKRIHKAEEIGDFAQAAHLRECSPFDTYNHPANKLAVKPDENTGMAKWRSGLSGLFIDNRVGLEREESRGIRTVEYWSILWVPRIFPAIDAAQGKKMSDIVREEHLDTEWLKSATDNDHAQTGVIQ